MPSIPNGIGLRDWILEFLGPQAMTPICLVGPYVPPNSESMWLSQISFSSKLSFPKKWHKWGAIPSSLQWEQDQMELKRWLFSPLTSPGLTSHRHTFKCIGHLSFALSCSGNSNCPLSGKQPQHFSNQVDLTGAERLAPPESLPKVLIPWEVVIFL